MHLLAPGPPTETSWPQTEAPAETQMTVFYKHSIYFIFKQLKILIPAGLCSGLCVPLGRSVYHTDPGAALHIEAQGLQGPLSCIADAHSGCCHHSWLTGPQGAPLQPHSLVCGQVPLVEALVDGQGLAQLGRTVAELKVFEGSSSNTFAEGVAKLPHGLQAPQGLQRSEQDTCSIPCGRDEASQVVAPLPKARPKLWG